MAEQGERGRALGRRGCTHDARWQLPEVQVLHGPSDGQGLLGVVQNVRHRVLRPKK